MSIPLPRAVVVPVIRELARCYLAFQRVSEAHIRKSGLTAPQFDIVATLGNTSGLSFKELGSRTLITKGTLTGVVDRLESRGLVERVACQQDGSSTLVRLTPAGDRMFDFVLCQHTASGEDPGRTRASLVAIHYFSVSSRFGIPSWVLLSRINFRST
ncbi:MAG: MarR family transcriptional regulator [Betaproteobacteria bacterium]|nr:MarR family transcriptional regulator [Betaproteobacteria bacterium]